MSQTSGNSQPRALFVNLGPKRLTFPSGLVNIESCATIGTNSLRPNTPEISPGKSWN